MKITIVAALLALAPQPKAWSKFMMPSELEWKSLPNRLITAMGVPSAALATHQPLPGAVAG